MVRIDLDRFLQKKSESMNRKTLLLNWFETLSSALGPSHWWPGITPFEVAVGAILTQNTNWSNVQKAVLRLRENGVLHPEKMSALSEDELARLIRPAGYFRIKAGRLKNFLWFLRMECNYNFKTLQKMELEVLRSRLLQVKGIGPETADSILLYALKKPSFVVDAYTKRILNRHFLVPEDIDYHELRSLFMDNLPEDVHLFNEYHALLVRTAKTWCLKKKPLCAGCPLQIYFQ